MNRKIIVLIGILSYGSFGVVVGSEAPVALFKQVETPYSNLEDGKLIPQMATVPVALTPEGKKIYDDLIAKYRNKTLTLVDNTKRNLEVLTYQKEILYRSLNYYRWEKAGHVEKALFPAVALGAAALVNYSGYLGHSALDYFINKESLSPHKSTIQLVDNIFSKGTSIGSALLLAFAGYIKAYDTIQGIREKIHNYFYSKSNEKIEKEIALIDSVLSTLKFYETSGK